MLDDLATVISYFLRVDIEFLFFHECEQAAKSVRYFCVAIIDSS